MTYTAKYSGPKRTGICVCGHSWEDHHLGMVMNPEYYEQTREAYVPQECEVYGFNETGGMKYDETAGEWRDHCDSYRDSGVID